MNDWYQKGINSGTAWFDQSNRPTHPYSGHPFYDTLVTDHNDHNQLSGLKGSVTGESDEYGSNARPGERTLYAERYAVDATLAQIRLAWKKFEDATTMGEIQAALAEVSRLVHGGH